ncbi:hypothetical protein HH800_05895 [Sphingobium yanoikuyae]|uniref:Uncharacterized protein n=1 Tax=Sphingobium yanoikuyae TaxID=13690 RepID=A0A6M4G3U9_SPHYA|nr:hypothetical protein [Sphingobium yanoikuyae]QJR01769.1 hypothetical protein HH800_05895 [Sphingobium yanoikuyae]
MKHHGTDTCVMREDHVGKPADHGLMCEECRAEDRAMAEQHMKRITLEVEGDVGPDDAREILDAVFAKLGRCWSERTEGPIYRGDGKHVGNARVQLLPFSLQMAREVKASSDPVEAAKWAASVHYGCEHDMNGGYLGHSDFCHAMHSAIGESSITDDEIDAALRHGFGDRIADTNMKEARHD